MKKIFLSLLVISVFTQCRTAKMALPGEEWQSKETFPVEGKQAFLSKETMRFGSFYITDVKRSWTKGTGSKFGLGKGNATDHDFTNIISLEHMKRKQTIRFALTDGQRNAESYCVSDFSAHELILGNRPNSMVNQSIDAVKSLVMEPQNKYYVQIYTVKNERPWEMLIDNQKVEWEPGKYKGYLVKDKWNYYTITPVRKIEVKNGNPSKALFGHVGFEFRNASGESVAAVSLLDKGVVYFQKVTAEEKFLLANACAALLMQEALG